MSGSGVASVENQLLPERSSFNFGQERSNHTKATNMPPKGSHVLFASFGATPNSADGDTGIVTDLNGNRCVVTRDYIDPGASKESTPEDIGIFRGEEPVSLYRFLPLNGNLKVK
jgi:hypothetical protein